VRVPLVINWPGRIKPAVQKDELVEFSDLLPTMCEVAGAPLPKNYPGDGLSLWPVLAGTGERNKEYVYIWYFRFTTWARNKDYGVLRGRTQQTVRYQKYPGLFESKTLDFDSATEKEQAVLQKLKGVMDELATADSLFMGVNAHKGRRATTKPPSEPVKHVQETAAPAAAKSVVSPAPFLLEPAGTRYEAEAGDVTGGAKPRSVSEASGGVLLAGMNGSTCSMSVDGGAGGTTELTLGYAVAQKAPCTLAINGVLQSLQLPGTGGWNTLGAAKLAVELKPGENNISFTSKGGMKLDYFEFEGK